MKKVLVTWSMMKKELLLIERNEGKSSVTK